jgi:hypothetical protein
MALGKRLINTGAAAAAACSTDSVQAFGADSAYSSNIALYQLDGNDDDTTGNYDGISDPNVTYSATGAKFGQAASFNGSSSQIDLGSSLIKQLPMTISLWLNPITSTNGAFYSNYSSSTEGFYCRVQSDGTFLVDAYNGGSNRTLLNNTTGSIPDNTWSHVAITFDSSFVILYINGSETDRVTTNANGIAFTASEPTKLGVRGTSSDWFNGLMDQVRIFDKAISAEDVGVLYAETTSTASNTNPFSEGAGVALYTMDYDASEASGYYDGESTNVEFGVGGKINYGARFNGSSSKIDLNSLSTVLDAQSIVRIVFL